MKSISRSKVPPELDRLYEVREWRHALAVLQNDFPEEWKDIVEILTPFRLLRSEIATPGGAKSPIASRIDSGLYERNWVEKSFGTKVVVDKTEHDTPTHGVDCFRNRVALEVEWNNKDPFFDRDLNNFRLLFDLRAISVGVIITRCDELQEIFNALGKGKSYGNSTTHLGKLIPRIEGGGGGGCPIVVFGMKKELYVDDGDGKPASGVEASEDDGGAEDDD